MPSLSAPYTERHTWITPLAPNHHLLLCAWLQCTCLPMMRENLQVSERFYVVLDKYCNKPKSPSFSSTMTPAIQFRLFPAIGKGFLFEYILKMLLSAVRVFDGSYRASEDCFVGWWKRSLPTKIGTRRSYTCLAPSTKGGRAE